MRNPETLLAHLPFLRGLARALVSDPELAEDLSQETSLALLSKGPRHEAAPRSWLARVMHNLAVSQRRSDLGRRRRERMSARSVALPSTAELVEREALRRKVVDAVMRLDEPYRATILYRFYEELPPREIAARLGIPVQTVKTRLKRGLQQLRQALDRDFGSDRGAWQAALLPFLGSSSTPAANSTAGIGALMGVAIMSLKAKVLAALLIVVALLGTWQLITPRDGASEQVQLTEVEGGGALEGPATSGGEVPSQGEASTESERSDSANRSRVERVMQRGSLRLSVRWEDDGSPVIMASGQLLTTQDLEGGRTGLGFVTGVDGGWRWESEPGLVRIEMDGCPPTDVHIKAGQQTDVDLELDLPSYWVSGMVVDGQDQPIPDAGIWLSARGIQDPEAVVAITADDGSFELRISHPPRSIAARHPNYSPSKLRQLEGEQGTTSVRFVLSDAGGSLLGVVLDPSGSPIENAGIEVGQHVRIFGEDAQGHSIGSSPPYRTRTGDDGRFLVEGLASGTIPVRVTSSGYTRQSFSADIVPGETTEAEFRLSTDISVYGRVTDQRSGGIPGTTIRAYAVDARGRPKEFLASATADESGDYTLEGMPDGAMHLTAARPGQTWGEVSTDIERKSAQAIEWNPVLPSNRRVAGKVLDHEGAPLSGCLISTKGGSFTSRTNPDGLFEIQFLPDEPLTVVVHDPQQRGYPMLRVEDVQPDTTDLIITVPRSARATAYFMGTLVDPQGRPIAGARVWAWLPGSGSGTWHTEPETGNFEVGPLPAGEYEIEFHAAGFCNLRAGAFHVAAEEIRDLGRLRLDAPASLLVHLRRTDDQPVAGVRGWIGDAQWHNLGSVRLEGGSGHSTKPLPAGVLRLHLHGGGIADRQVLFTAIPGATSELHVALDIGVSRALQVVLPSTGVPGKKTWVKVVNEKGDICIWHPFRLKEPAQLEVSGRFCLGEHRVEIHTGDTVTYRGSFSIEDLSRRSDPMTVHVQ